MPSAATLALFSTAALALLAVPGPAVLYITGRSAAQGRRAGLISVLGIHTGSVVHLLAAVAGLSAVLVASAAAFTVTRWLGAAYLIGLGLCSDGLYAIAGAHVGQRLRDRRHRRPADRRSRRPGGQLAEGGLLVGLGVASLAVPAGPRAD